MSNVERAGILGHILDSKLSADISAYVKRNPQMPTINTNATQTFVVRWQIFK